MPCPSFPSHDRLDDYHTFVRHDDGRPINRSLQTRRNRVKLLFDHGKTEEMDAPVLGGGTATTSTLASMTTTLNMRAHMTKEAPTPTPTPSVLSVPSVKTGKTSSAHTSAPHISDKFAIPLSSRHAEALDLNTVERRGQPMAAKEYSKTSRPHGLHEALTFRPTEEEFKNPMDYIKKIAPQARPYGICKIIPPDGWNPDFAIDTEVCTCQWLLYADTISHDISAYTYFLMSRHSWRLC